MSIFDLLFIVAFLGAVVTLFVAAFHLARGRWQRARSTLCRLGIAVAAYLGAVVVVSIATPADVKAIGSPRCFDDWCITVQHVERRSVGTAEYLDVKLVLSSHAAGIAQGERDARVFVVDDNNERYLPVDDPAAVPLSARISPLASIDTHRMFRLPSAAVHPRLIVAHGWFPHCCIIGDPESLLHRATVVRLD